MLKKMTIAAGLLLAVMAANGCKNNQPVEVAEAPAFESRPLSEPVTMDLPPSPRASSGVMIDPVAPANWPMEAPPVVEAPQAQRTYVVQRGDTLWSIATRLYGDGKKHRDIAAANAISDPNKLQAGQKLIIP